MTRRRTHTDTPTLPTCVPSARLCPCRGHRSPVPTTCSLPSRASRLRAAPQRAKGALLCSWPGARKRTRIRARASAQAARARRRFLEHSVQLLQAALLRFPRGSALASRPVRANLRGATPLRSSGPPMPTRAFSPDDAVDGAGPRQFLSDRRRTTFDDRSIHRRQSERRRVPRQNTMCRG